MNLEQQFEIPAGVVARNLAGEMVILDLEKGIYFGLNAIGTRIWELLAKGSSVAQAKQMIVAEYEVTETAAERDLTALVAELETRGLIIPVERA